ncbi:Polyphosphate kinase 2 (PPK2) [Microbacterium trichothecenolyticum]|uniref:ADP/GDP-polyphosphate phosphotransferase n=1 Tax=Microbacterium trichothecenolyticum TaxID=69370 RepID=A0A0M2HBZ5_MICTR|nr:Polyphosphate kinase 2 (PPK2) [Microbacterium trichothecenolyticum]
MHIPRRERTPCPRAGWTRYASAVTKKSAKKSSVKRLNKRLYKAELERLQTELVEMQQWVASSGNRVLVLFEGRDAAGKGGAIKRVMEYLNPRHARVVALPKPSKKERGQWYFQRYIERLPTAGEIVLMDRSWYNRAGVERVLGYCTEEKYQEFLRQAPVVEHLLIEDGIILIKYWFSVSDDEQQARFASRVGDPMRRWKLSPTDLESILRWEDYSRAKDAMFAATDTKESPWWTVESDDKRSARLNVISHLLSAIPHGRLELDEVSIPDRPDGDGYERPPADQFNYVPDIAADLSAAKSKKAA